MGGCWLVFIFYSIQSERSSPVFKTRSDVRLRTEKPQQHRTDTQLLNFLKEPKQVKFTI